MMDEKNNLDRSPRDWNNGVQSADFSRAFVTRENPTKVGALNAVVEMSWTIAFLLFSLFFHPFVALAHEGHDHAEEKKTQTTTQPTAGVRTAERNVQTEAGQFQIKLQQTPSDPRSGEEIKFVVRFTEKIEGGFAGSEAQPLEGANVIARITNTAGQNVAENIQTQSEGQNAYSLRYAISSSGNFKIIFDVKTKDGRAFTVDFPVAVTAAPVNWIFWLGFVAITLLSFGTIGGYFAALDQRENVGRKLRKTLPVAIAAFVFFAVGTAALAFFQPPRERRGKAELEAASKTNTGPEAIGEGHHGPHITITKESQLLFGIHTSPVVSRQITGGLKVTGVVKAKPDARAVIAPPVSGRIFLKQGLTIGSAVGRGERIGYVEQILGAPEQAELEARRTELRTAALEQQAKQAEQKALAQQARTRLAQAQRELQRAKNLYEVGAAPKKRVEEAETAVKLAEQEAASAEQQAKLATEQARLAQASIARVNPVRIFPILSPITGLINEMKVTTGQQVEAGVELLSVTNLSTVFLEAQVFEKELQIVRDSDRASFVAAGIPNEVFKIGEGEGQLLTIGQTVNAETRTVPVIYEVKNPLNRLRDGMFVEITIDTTGKEKALSIPKGAVVNEQGQTFVFVFEGGETFEKRAVVLGAEGQDFYEIRSGLEEGERVVVEGIYQLRSAKTN